MFLQYLYHECGLRTLKAAAAVRYQKAVTVHFSSKQLLPSGFAAPNTTLLNGPATVSPVHNRMPPDDNPLGWQLMTLHNH